MQARRRVTPDANERLPLNTAKEDNVMKNFLSDESGAVTVDWVVLTAALVGLGLATMSVIGDGVGAASNDTSERLASIDSEVEWDLGGQSGDGGTRSFDLANYSDLADWRVFGAADSSEYARLSGLASVSDSELFSNASSLAADAADTGTITPNLRRANADLYAQNYGELQSRGADVSGLPHPDDVAASAQS